MASIPITVQLINAPTSGSTVTRKKADGDISMIIKPAALLLTLTVALGSGDFDGQRCHIMSTQVITTMTMTATTLVNALVGLSQYGTGTFQWSATDSTWYRIGN